MDQTAIIAAVGVPVASALIAIGVWLGKRDHGQPSLTSVPATMADVAEAKRLAEDAKRAADGAQTSAAASKQATDGLLPRVARAEQDIQEHDGILRKAEVDIGKIAERLKVKMEAIGGKRESG